MSLLDDIQERIQRLSEKRITRADLPMKEITQQLLGGGNIDPNELLLPHMIGYDLLKTEIKGDFDALAARITALESAPLQVPVGGLIMASRIAEPTNYLLCDGRAVSRTTYAGLFAVTNTKFGVGDGSTTFNLPNLGASRFPLGASADAGIGVLAGAATVTLGVGEIPAHDHAFGTLAVMADGAHGHANTFAVTSTGSGHNHGTRATQAANRQGSLAGAVLTNLAAGGVTGTTDTSGTHTHTMSGSVTAVGTHTHGISGSTANNAGGGGAHSNMPPSQAVAFMIRFA